MKKLSFIKGLAFGTLFSAFFWVGAYQAVTSLAQNENPQDLPIENAEFTEIRASF
ncbi:MAG: hypothetical protein AB8F94_10555 [Saprospiraceae bacterium]